MRKLHYEYNVTLPDGTEDALPLEPHRTVGEVLDLLRKIELTQVGLVTGKVQG